MKIKRFNLKKIRGLIGNGAIGEALESLQNVLDSKSPYIDDVTILNSRHSHLTKEVRAGNVSREDVMDEQKEITTSLTELLPKLEITQKSIDKRKKKKYILIGSSLAAVIALTLVVLKLVLQPNSEEAEFQNEGDLNLLTEVSIDENSPMSDARGTNTDSISKHQALLAQPPMAGKKRIVSNIAQLSNKKLQKEKIYFRRKGKEEVFTLIFYAPAFHILDTFEATKAVKVKTLMEAIKEEYYELPGLSYTDQSDSQNVHLKEALFSNNMELPIGKNLLEAGIKDYDIIQFLVVFSNGASLNEMQFSEANEEQISFKGDSLLILKIDPVRGKFNVDIPESDDNLIVDVQEKSIKVSSASSGGRELTLPLHRFRFLNTVVLPIDSIIGEIQSSDSEVLSNNQMDL